MTNILEEFNPELWSAVLQPTFFKENVAIGIAATELRADLQEGDTLQKPFGSYARVQTYTKGTDIVVKDVTSTEEFLFVDTAKVASFYIDKIDRTQNKYDAMTDLGEGAIRQLTNNIDQAVFSEYSNAGKTLDDGDVGGTAGNGIVSTQSNIANIFTAAGRTLNNKKRLSPNRFALIGPRMLETIQLYVGARETGFGEVVSANGHVGTRFGFNLKLSNNLPWTATLGLATQVTEGDTVVINGVTFTFNADPSGAGSVDIGGSEAITVDNLVAAINDTGTAGTTYIQLSAEDRQLLEESGIAATDGTTEITFVGYGDIVTSETLSDPTDAWSAQTQYSLMGVHGAISLVTQLAPQVEVKDAQLRLGKYVHPFMLYGKKTFTRMKDSLVAVQFDVSSWV